MHQGKSGKAGSRQDDELPPETLKIKLLSDDAVTPTRSTPSSAGLDLHSTVDALIRLHSTMIIPIDIAVEPSQGTYAQIATWSSMAAKGITVLGGVLNPDYRGNIKVILQNNSSDNFEIKKKQ